MSDAPGLIKPDLETPQKVADGLREMAERQSDPFVASMMNVAADTIEADLDLIAHTHRAYADLVNACG